MTLVQTLNPEQQQAVDHFHGPLLVLAGAGSGKTRVVTARIVKLLESGVPSYKILGLTFTNKAAGEMAERVRSQTSHSVTLCTFHSLGVRVLRECAEALGYKNDFVIYDEEDSVQLLKGCIREVGGVLKDIKKATKTIKGLISKAKNALLGPQEVDTRELETDAEKAYPAVYALYQKRLKEAGAVDFDDLLFQVVYLFQQHPEILEKFQSRWEYLLVDEYQDTNVAQYQIVRMLTNKSGNLFVVGDPDQSIYSWRGADISNILNFEKDFPNARVIRLEQNYRSRSNILKGANGLIRHNDSRFEKNLWSDRGEGEKISLITCEHEKQEVEAVVSRIRHFLDSGQFSLKEMVIFYRTNFQSRLFEDELLRQRVPYVIIGGLSFYQRREIKDILAFLRMVQMPSDTIAFARTINLPKRGMGQKTVEKLIQGAAAAELPVLDFAEAVVKDQQAVKLSARQKSSLADYLCQIRKLQRISNEGTLEELVTAAIQDTGYLGHLNGDPETAQDRKENVYELAFKASDWEEGADEVSLQTFLEELSLKGSADEADTSEEKLSLMTVHNGKGLEFDVAFVVGLEEDLFPHINSKLSYDSIEEERRLCYVGMTRAKERLFLSWVRYRRLWGGARNMRPSRFLKEIPIEYVEAIAPRCLFFSPSPPQPSVKVSAEYQEGDAVFHTNFGVGKVERLYSGSLGAMVDVAFTKDDSRRSLVVDIAPLKKL